MGIFTQEDHIWFKHVQSMPDKYMIIIDNDSVWVQWLTGEYQYDCAYTFSLYGYEFIHGLLNDMGINAEFC